MKFEMARVLVYSVTISAFECFDPYFSQVADSHWFSLRFFNWFLLFFYVISRLSSSVFISERGLVALKKLIRLDFKSISRMIAILMNASLSVQRSMCRPYRKFACQISKEAWFIWWIFFNRFLRFIHPFLFNSIAVVFSHGTLSKGYFSLLFYRLPRQYISICRPYQNIYGLLIINEAHNIKMF